MSKTTIPEDAPGDPVLYGTVQIPGRVKKKYCFSKRGRAVAYVFDFKAGHTLIRDKNGLGLVFYYKDRKEAWEWIREHTKRLKRLMP